MWSNITSVNTKAAGGYKILLVLTPWGVVGCSALKGSRSEWQAQTCSHAKWVPPNKRQFLCRPQVALDGMKSDLVGFFIFFVMFFFMLDDLCWFVHLFDSCIFFPFFSHSLLAGSTRGIAVTCCVQVEAPEPPKAAEVPKVPELPKAQKGIRVRKGKTTMMDLCGLLNPFYWNGLYIPWSLANVIGECGLIEAFLC